MSMLAVGHDGFGPSRTVQSFKDSTDINKILKKAQVAGSLSFAQKYSALEFGVFADVDLLQAHELVERAKAIFRDAPAEVRREFNNDPFAFAGYAADPQNVDRLAELLPALAEPGRQLPNPVRREGPSGPSSEPQASVSPPQGDSVVE